MTDTRIMLSSGALFDLTDPFASDFTLVDIAHGLARVCRFAGQTNRFYSVAEHCVHVARLVPLEHARAALLHDAAEAFIGDVTRPLKALLPDYRKIESKVEDAISDRMLTDRHGVVDYDAIHHPLIKRADTAMCLVEARELMPHAPGYWSALQIDPEDWQRARTTRLNCDRPEYAAAAWLRMWHRYGHYAEQQPEPQPAAQGDDQPQVEVA